MFKRTKTRWILVFIDFRIRWSAGNLSLMPHVYGECKKFNGIYVKWRNLPCIKLQENSMYIHLATMENCLMMLCILSPINYWSKCYKNGIKVEELNRLGIGKYVNLFIACILLGDATWKFKMEECLMNYYWSMEEFQSWEVF